MNPKPSRPRRPSCHSLDVALRRPPFNFPPATARELVRVAKEAGRVREEWNGHPPPSWDPDRRQAVWWARKERLALVAELSAMREEIGGLRVGDRAGVLLAGRLDALEPRVRWLLGRDLAPEDFEGWQEKLCKVATGDADPQGSFRVLLDRLERAAATLSKLRLPTREQDPALYPVARHLWLGWRDATGHGDDGWREVKGKRIRYRQRAGRRGAFLDYMRLAFEILLHPQRLSESQHATEKLAKMAASPQRDAEEREILEVLEARERKAPSR